MELAWAFGTCGAAVFLGLLVRITAKGKGLSLTLLPAPIIFFSCWVDSLSLNRRVGA